MYKEERGVFEEMRNIDKCDMEAFESLAVYSCVRLQAQFCSRLFVRLFVCLFAQGVWRGPGDEDHGQLPAERRHPHRKQAGGR